MTKPTDLSDSQTNPFVSLEHEHDEAPLKYRNYYGAMIPIGGTPHKPLLLIGPDWRFFAGMVAFLVVVGAISCGMCARNYDIDSVEFIGAVSITLIMLLLYTVTAMRDPGVVKEARVDIEKINIETSDDICSVCQVVKKRRRFHCEFCNVCIDGHDHHCPWTSKCIGNGNITTFYGFLLSTSLFFVYHILVSLSPFIKPTK